MAVATQRVVRSEARTDRMPTTASIRFSTNSARSTCAPRWRSSRRARSASAGNTSSGSRSPARLDDERRQRRLQLLADARDQAGGGGSGAARLGQQCRLDAQVAAAAAVIELLGQRRHQHAGERLEVGLAGDLGAVEQGPAPGVDLLEVALEHRGEQAVAVLEVVVDRRAVSLPGRRVDLVQRDGVRPALREQALGGVQDRAAGGVSGASHATSFEPEGEEIASYCQETSLHRAERWRGSTRAAGRAQSRLREAFTLARPSSTTTRKEKRASSPYLAWSCPRCFSII